MWICVCSFGTESGGIGSLESLAADARRNEAPAKGTAAASTRATCRTPPGAA
eukprot:CAMPEP_0172676938 /NCGR_PEP_ID=MMETSP1074-20121228/14330_1 /TAXON_ID=2916 /ORGANISM="Ceratium fusus, Strain PA161109" /LENGTH=51 /DNA_ID=CAMNT_0013494695 /DNA_START=233 /DNA_END=384 /DNA_ORIENTATION=+